MSVMVTRRNSPSARSRRWLSKTSARPSGSPGFERQRPHDRLGRGAPVADDEDAADPHQRALRDVVGDVDGGLPGHRRHRRDDARAIVAAIEEHGRERVAIGGDERLVEGRARHQRQLGAQVGLRHAGQAGQPDGADAHQVALA